jgi:MFS transporter, DHA2 family, multidrug resistance protein
MDPWDQIISYFVSRGYAPANATIAAAAQVNNMLEAQSRILSYMDCFYVIGIITLVVAPLVLWTWNFKVDSEASGGH